MSDLISRSEVLEELNKYENELRKDKTEAIETDDEQMLFAITNQETAICRIRRNIMHMQIAYDIDKVVDELEERQKEYLSGFGVHNNDEMYGVACGLGDAIEIVKQGDIRMESD